MDTTNQVPEGFCGTQGCVFLPFHTGPHTWEIATVTVLRDSLSTPDDAA